MSSYTHWVCPSCGAWVPLSLTQCPRCRHVFAPLPSEGYPSTPVSVQRQPTWVRGISIPSALLGIVAFFLPWFQMSCGPVKLSLSGYEIATGRWKEKFEPKHVEEFYSRADKAMGINPKPRAMRPPERKQQAAEGEEAHPIANDSQPLLWVVPASCAALLLLGSLGLPRAPTLAVVVLASAYFAYFGVTSEQQLTDPGLTGGFFDHSWLLGFWASWLGLVAPGIVALLKPRSQ